VQELRIARSRAGMTLMELEAASGVGASTISKIERGVTHPQAITVHKLADALGVEVGELYPKAQAPPPEPDYGALLEERGFPSEQIAAYLAQNERDQELIARKLEKMSAKDFREALLASPPLRRILQYYRENDAGASTPPRSESA
jgi:transcriptional regulator with XRE-family HTH domain